MEKINPILESFKNSWKEAQVDMRDLTFKYPVVATVSLLVFSILGISLIFSFSITAFLSSAVLISLAASIALSISKEPQEFFDRLKKGVMICCVDTNNNNNNNDGSGSGETKAAVEVSVGGMKFAAFSSF